MEFWTEKYEDELESIKAEQSTGATRGICIFISTNGKM